MNYLYKYTLFFVLMMSLSTSLLAQKKDIELNIIGQNQSEQKLIKKYSIASKYTQADTARKAVREMILHFQNEGFWEAKLIQWKDSNSIIKASINLGNIYKWKKLERGNLDLLISQQINFKEKYYQNRPFYQSDIESLQEDILEYSENNGHPFATFRLDSLVLDSLNHISAKIAYEPGPEILFDTLYIEGDVPIKNKFLAKFLHIRAEKLFEQNKVNKIPNLLKTLPYLKLTQAPSLSFRFDRAYPKLVLKKRKANEVNGILGFLPNENPQSQRSLLLTGSLNLSLHNLLNTGKYLGFKWERLQISTQRLNIRYENPILFGSDLDLSFNFNLLSQDSSFVNRLLNLSLYYRLGNGGRVKLNLEDRKSTLGEANLFRELDFLPEVSEINYFSYGLGYDWSSLDDINFPHQGTQLSFLFRTGTKKIQKNPFVPDSLYNNIQLRSTQVVLEADVQRFFSLGQKSVLKLRTQGGYIGNQTLFVNELFRVGGLESLRGHNENVFFASAYSISTIEYQWYFEPESYFLLFYDQGFLQERTQNNSKFNNPSGVGIGLNFSVSAGSFRLIYALGRTQEQIFSFNRAKIHFGLLSRF